MDFGKKYFNGNFSVLKLKKGDDSVIRVSAVSENFAVEYGESSMMYMYIDNLEWSEDEVTDDMRVLGVMITNIYCVGTMLDAELHKDVLVAIDGALKRVEATDVTEESENEDIESVKTGMKLKEELASMQGESQSDDN